MDKRQKFALSFPISSQSDFQKDHKRIVQIGRCRVSTVLTVDVAGDRCKWHASVSALGPDSKPVGLIGAVAKTDGDLIMAYCIKMLKGVGVGNGHTFRPERGQGFHLFKDLTKAELAVAKEHTSRPSLPSYTMTPQELEVDRIRQQALDQMDPEKMKEYCAAIGVTLSSDEVLLAGLHKACILNPNKTESQKTTSRLWLISHGYSTEINLREGLIGAQDILGRAKRDDRNPVLR